MDIIRQGDVALLLIEKIPSTAQKQEGLCILAYGEVTGHSHQVSRGAEIWVDVNDLGRRYLKVLDNTSLDHEEHGYALLSPGKNYEIIIQREYHPIAIRSVVD